MKTVKIINTELSTAPNLLRRHLFLNIPKKPITKPIIPNTINKTGEEKSSHKTRKVHTILAKNKRMETLPSIYSHLHPFILTVITVPVLCFRIFLSLFSK